MSLTIRSCCIGLVACALWACGDDDNATHIDAGDAGTDSGMDASADAAADARDQTDAANDDEDANVGDAAFSDAAFSDAAFNMDAGDSGAAACFMNAITHFEIINACTDSEAIDKLSVLPNLLSDGGLPAIP